MPHRKYDAAKITQEKYQNYRDGRSGLNYQENSADPFSSQNSKFVFQSQPVSSPSISKQQARQYQDAIELPEIRQPKTLLSVTNPSDKQATVETEPEIRSVSNAPSWAATQYWKAFLGQRLNTVANPGGENPVSSSPQGSAQTAAEYRAASRKLEQAEKSARLTAATEQGNYFAEQRERGTENQQQKYAGRSHAQFPQSKSEEFTTGQLANNILSKLWQA